MGTFILIGAFFFIIGLLFGYLMDEKPIIIYKLRKDSRKGIDDVGNGTSDKRVKTFANDDLG